MPVFYHELLDVSTCGQELPWVQKRLSTERIAESYYRIGNNYKSNCLCGCGTFLEFKKFTDGSQKLNHANFCRVRLCPMCTWRRSLKVFSQISRVMDETVKQYDVEFLFLTLTIRNVDGPHLSQAISDMMRGYDKMFKRRVIMRTVLGSFRTLEITHNHRQRSKWFNTFHPHFHLILAVPKNYYKDFYLNQEEWTNIWKESMNLDYEPICYIQKVKNTKSGADCVTPIDAIKEVAKYSVKESDLLVKNNKLQDFVVSTLDGALDGRRLCSFRGIFDKIRKQMKLDDPEDGDLIITDGDSLRSDLEFILVRYRWNYSWSAYFEIDENNDFKETFVEVNPIVE